MNQVMAALRLEETLLELLLFKLVETRLLLRDGAGEFVWRSTVEVEAARRQAQVADLARAALVDAMWPPPTEAPAATLRELARRSSEPWARMLRDHHASMSTLVAEIEIVAHDNAVLASHGLRLCETQTSGSTDGDTVVVIDGDDLTSASIGDACGYGSVAGAADALRMPALQAFLR